MSNKYIFFAGIIGILLVVGGATIVTTFKETTPVATPTPKPVNQITQTSQKAYTMDEVAKHKTADDCWLVIDKTIYNVTKFIPDHPGGQEILKGCGRDATMMFQGEREHQENNASSYLPEFKIGVLQ